MIVLSIHLCSRGKYRSRHHKHRIDLFANSVTPQASNHYVSPKKTNKQTNKRYRNASGRSACRSSRDTTRRCRRTRRTRRTSMCRTAYRGSRGTTNRRRRTRRTDLLGMRAHTRDNTTQTQQGPFYFNIKKAFSFARAQYIYIYKANDMRVLYRIATSRRRCRDSRRSACRRRRRRRSDRSARARSACRRSRDTSCRRRRTRRTCRSDSGRSGGRRSPSTTTSRHRRRRTHRTPCTGTPLLQSRCPSGRSPRRCRRPGTSP
jgi:hypothetical protein